MRFDWKTAEVSAPESLPTPTRLKPGRVPLLWVLVPLVIGYVCADAGWAPPAGSARAIAAGGLTCAVVSAWPRRVVSAWRDRAWACGLVAAVFAIATLWHARCLPPPPDRAGLPPREAVLAVRVDELFQSASGAPSGLGTVESAPGHLRDLDGCRIRFRLTAKRGETPDPAVDLGALVRMRGVLENAPAGDGFARYLRQRGVPFTLSRAKVDAVEAPASAFRRACTRARSRVAEALGVGVAREDAARLSALMLGRTSLLAPAEREDFKRAGATHLFAISGLHITGIAAGLVWLARRTRVRDVVALPVILGGLWLYVQMAGAPPSAMRAWVMAVCVAGALATGRGARPFGGLVAAAVVTAVCDPAALRDPGFLLSYTVVASILLYAAPLAERVDKAWRPWRFIPPDALGWWRTRVQAHKRTVISACAVTFGATLAGLPAAAALFGQVSVIGLVANLVLVPMSGPPVILGFVTSTLGVCGAGAWAGPFNAVAAWFMRAAAWCAHGAASAPAAALPVVPAPVWATGLAVGLTLAALLVYPPRPDRSARRFAALPAAVVAYFMLT